MTLEINDLDETWQPQVVAYLRRAPYRNAIPLSNVTQLCRRCTVVVAQRGGHIQGVASHYHDLPFLGLTFVAELGEPLPALLEALALRVPTLRGTTLTTVVPEHRARQLANYAHIEAMEPEIQMVVEPETLRVQELPTVRQLRADDLPAMQALAARCNLVAWRPEVVSLGPAFGACVDGELVAMATTHFATPDVIEIGNIATHPDYRHRGLARACISALVQACFSLAPRVYLMVMANNEAALATYRSIGFWPAERFAFTSFRLVEG